MFDSNIFSHDASAFKRMVELVPGALSIPKAKFQNYLDKLPPAGAGMDCHPKLLGAATLGFKAGFGADELVDVIKAALKPGGREVSRKEIRDAVERAMQDTISVESNPPTWAAMKNTSRKKLSNAEAAQVRKHVLSYSNGPVNLDSEDFRRAHGIQLEQQPMNLLYPAAFTMTQLISDLFKDDDLLYIGSEMMDGGGRGNILPAEEWTLFFKEQQQAILERVGNTDWNSPTPSAFLLNLGMRYSHIVPNPVTGCFGKTKDGKDSLRCDGSVRDFRYAVFDFDGHDTLEKQGEVLHCLCEAMDIRICALIQTGGRDGYGVHAWVKIDGVDSLESWNEKVRDGMFPTFEALGADPACANPSRGSRLPSVYRWGTSAWQRLVFVSKEGVKI